MMSPLFTNFIYKQIRIRCKFHTTLMLPLSTLLHCLPYFIQRTLKVSLKMSIMSLSRLLWCWCWCWCSVIHRIGYSDPYCMLGIQPEGGLPISPLPLPPTPRTLSADMGGFDNTNTSTDSSSSSVPHRKHSFRLSFKRREGGRREHRDSLGGPVPAKFISATTIKPHTLNPKWNEKFKL